MDAETQVTKFAAGGGCCRSVWRCSCRNRFGNYEAGCVARTLKHLPAFRHPRHATCHIEKSDAILIDIGQAPDSSNCNGMHHQHSWQIIKLRRTPMAQPVQPCSMQKLSAQHSVFLRKAVFERRHWINGDGVGYFDRWLAASRAASGRLSSCWTPPLTCKLAILRADVAAAFKRKPHPDFQRARRCCWSSVSRSATSSAPKPCRHALLPLLVTSRPGGICDRSLARAMVVTAVHGVRRRGPVQHDVPGLWLAQS